MEETVASSGFYCSIVFAVRNVEKLVERPVNLVVESKAINDTVQSPKATPRILETLSQQRGRGISQISYFIHHAR